MQIGADYFSGHLQYWQVLDLMEFNLRHRGHCHVPGGTLISNPCEKTTKIPR